MQLGYQVHLPKKGGENIEKNNRSNYKIEEYFIGKISLFEIIVKLLLEELQNKKDI